MPAESKSLSEFPRALEVLSGALLLISNPSGQDSFDTNSALLTEVAQAMLDVHYTQELGDVSVFDAIKNCRVLSGTTTPTSALGVDGQLYIKYETTGGADEVVAMYFKKSSAWLEISLGGGGNTDYIECTQAQYDAWEQAGTLDPTVMYFITDGQTGGSSTLAGLSDVNLTNPTDGQLLRYNGTSGKWENAGIINDTTASASSVYSSAKVKDLLDDKQDKTASEYQVGDTITASVYKHCSGRTTNAGDKVLFFYPTAKPINANSASIVVNTSMNGNCYTSTGAIALKSGTYIGQITDGGIYFLIDLTSSFTDGGRCATVEMQTRTITFS